MKLHISFNGKDINLFHLEALDGTLNALMKPTEYKKPITNENAAADGAQVLSAPSVRKKASRTVSMPFLLRVDSLVDIPKALEYLEQELVNGYEMTGINHVYVAELDTTYKLYYSNVASYTNFGLDGAARVTIKFTEYNPSER